jgi:hypothetical protein
MNIQDAIYMKCVYRTVLVYKVDEKSFVLTAILETLIVSHVSQLETITFSTHTN